MLYEPVSKAMELYMRMKRQENRFWRMNFMRTDIKNQNYSQLNNSSKREELNLKIKNRYSWLIIGSISIVIVGTMYAFIFKDIKIGISSLISILLAFFSIYLSSLFYFKTTEQSNQFYDSTYKYTKDIHVLLSQMEGKFNKSLEVLEKGNETIRKRMEGNNEYFDYLGKTNSSIQSIANKKDELLESRLFSKLKMSEKEKEDIKQELHNLEKEKSVLQYQLNELVEETDLNTKSSQLPNKKHSYEDIKKWYQNKKGENSFPGAIYEIIYDQGPENILNMPKEQLRNLLKQEILNPYEQIDEDNKNIIFKTFINIGFIDEKTNDISEELLHYIKEEAKEFI